MPNPATPFLPVLILLLLAVGVAAAILVISGVLLPKLKPNNPSDEKLSAYECGVPEVQPGARHCRDDLARPRRLEIANEFNNILR